MTENLRQADALTFEIPPEVLTASVKALCDFQEDRGVSYPELALSVFKAIVSHPHFPRIYVIANQPNIVS